MIEANNITVQRGGKNLIDDATMSVSAGSITGLLGPNGAGKTTLLRVLAGLIQPDAGSVQLAGTLLNDWPPQELARRRAVLSQSSAVPFAMRARDVVALGRTPHKCSNAPHDPIVAEALAYTGMRALADRDFATLSGGERQRVHLARVLAQIWHNSPSSPCVLFLDEPANNLDIAQQQLVLRIAVEFAKSGGAVVMIHHDLHAFHTCHSVFLLKKGRKLASGPPCDVLQAEVLSEAFGIKIGTVTSKEHGLQVSYPTS